MFVLLGSRTDCESSTFAKAKIKGREMKEKGKKRKGRGERKRMH